MNNNLVCMYVVALTLAISTGAYAGDTTVSHTVPSSNSTAHSTTVTNSTTGETVTHSANTQLNDESLEHQSSTSVIKNGNIYVSNRQTTLGYLGNQTGASLVGVTHSASSIYENFSYSPYISYLTHNRTVTISAALQTNGHTPYFYRSTGSKRCNPSTNTCNSFDKSTYNTGNLRDPISHNNEYFTQTE